MTLDVFRVVVEQYGLAGGVSFLNLNTGNDTEVDRVILRGLKDFTRYTFGIYDITRTFTTVASSATYNVSGMFQIDHLMVDGTVLRNYDGGIGPESRSRLFRRSPAFHDDPVDIPTVWVWQPPGQILFHPTPASAYVIRMAGFREHQDFTLGAVGSGITLEIEDHISDVAGLWIAMKFKFPHMEGEVLFNQIAALDAIASDKIQDYRSSNLGQNLGYAKRSHDTPRYFT